MRIATLVLVIVIALLQWPLWVGKGSWLTVWQLQDQLEEQRAGNKKLAARNASLTAEVNNLKTGYDAVEERARSELGMIKQDEVFFQVLKPGSMTPNLPKPIILSPVPAPGASAPAEQPAEASASASAETP